MGHFLELFCFPFLLFSFVTSIVVVIVLTSVQGG